MTTYDYDLVCIGSGPAGEKAATQAGYFHKRVAVVERQSSPGGAMVNTGTVPSKALRETALLCSALHRRPLPGHEFRLDHELSVHRFMAHRHKIEQQEHDRIESSFDRHDIDVVPGHGRLLDAHTVEVERPDGSRTVITAEFILVATGSSPVRPDHVPFDHPSVVDADGVLELDRLPASMVIVGGGVIGSEYASIFSEIDVEVTLVHPRAGILPFLDVECRDHLQASMQESGIHLRLNTTVASVRPAGDRSVLVQLDRGGDVEEIETEVLLWAAGRQSNTTGIGLEDTGVEMGERGLVPVNGSYRTNVPSIYAAGDVIGFPALAATSMEQGRIAACDMFGIDFKQKIAETMPIGIYTVPAVSMVGKTGLEAMEAGLDVVTGRALYRFNVRGRMLGDERGILKCVFERGTQKLVGACVVGEQATEVVHLASCAIAHGAGIEYFINACFNYPSLCELYKYAAYDALQNVKRNQTDTNETHTRAA